MMYDPPHPGELLKEDYLQPLGLTITAAAKGLDISQKQLSQIVNGKAGISPAMAIKLAHAFDTSPELWLNMQDQYNLWHAQKSVDLKKITSYQQKSPLTDTNKIPS